MEFAKKRRRRMALFIVFAAVLLWVGGCAAGQSVGLSALIPMAEKETSAKEDLVGGVVEGNVDGDNYPISVPDSHKEKETTEPSGNKDKDTGSENEIKPDVETDGNGGSESSIIEKKPPTEETIKPNQNEKQVALTFDDGPDTRYTTAILDILKEKGVKATFFVVGTQVEKYPDILKRMVDEGHSIGNHSQTHKDLRKLSKSQILSEIEKTDNAIENVLGYKPSMFRAPYGALSNTVMRVLKEKDQQHIGWTVDTRDWAGTSVEDMRDMIRNETKPNGIILMHSFGGKHIINTVNMLSGAIDDLEERGYSFVTVEELPTT